MTRLGGWLLALASLMAVGAPWLALHPPDLQYRSHVFAPPMPPHLRLPDGQWRAPFYYPLRLGSGGVRRFVEDRSQPIPLAFAAAGTLVSGTADQPWFPIGTDSLGRDIWSRLVFGARTSLSVALAATGGALFLGALLGAVAGMAGGWFDEAAMRASDLVLVLPSLYVVLALRAAMPLVLDSGTVFILLVAVLAVVGAPVVARGVRGIVVAERARDYVTAARALGAGPWRIAFHHTLPAAGGFLLTQGLLLAPAFVLAESTLSFVGLGFAPPTASWGSMLQEGVNVRALADFPWVLAPAVAISLVVLGLTLAAEPRVDAGQRPK